MKRDTLWERLARGVHRLQHRSDWSAHVTADWPERIMQTPVTDRYHAKQGRSTGRLILDQGGRRLTVYLKRHYQLPWWCGWLAALWPDGAWSPALQEAQHLERARQIGVPVPQVVAAGEFIGPWGKLQSFLAVEELTDMLPLHEAIPLAATRLAPRQFARWKRSLIGEMARLTRHLHEQNYYHKDLYLCHFYIAREDTARLPRWRDRVHLIDLHRLGHHCWMGWLWQSKDLAQLLYSSALSVITPRDRLRFWRAYLGVARETPRSRWLRRLVLLRWRRYRDHNARRRFFGFLGPQRDTRSLVDVSSVVRSSS